MLIWTKTKFAHVRRHDRTFKKQSCVQCLHSDEQNTLNCFLQRMILQQSLMIACIFGLALICMVLISRAKIRFCAPKGGCNGSRSLFEVLLLSFSRTLLSGSSQCCEGCAPSGETELKHATLEEETAQPSADEDASDSGSGDALLSDLGNLSSEEH